MAKAEKKYTIKENEINVNASNVIKKYTLNFTDIVKNNNKYYNLEIQEDSNNKFYIYTTYGRVGSTAAKEYRLCSSKEDAIKSAEKIIKSKVKKGYVEVALTQASVGSFLAQSQINNQVNISAVTLDTTTSSNLHKEVLSLVSTLFKSTQNYININLDTNKCPLGQLSLEQISKGKDILLQAQKEVNSSKDIAVLDRLTNLYYSNIPHHFGSRIDTSSVRLDDNVKINNAVSMLQVFENNKDFSKVLTENIENQYNSLNSNIFYVESSSEQFVWLNKLVERTRAKNHHFLGKIRLKKAYYLNKASEEELFLSTTQKISENCIGRHVPHPLKEVWEDRILCKHEELYKKANVLPLFHGSITPNVASIISKSLLVKHDKIGSSGSMYGRNALYFADNSTKSINYTSAKNSYWAKGNDSSGYIFVTDVCLGNFLIAEKSYRYSLDDLGDKYHSVYAKAGKSGILNDEFMIYSQGQNCLRYLLEIECY